MLKQIQNIICVILFFWTVLLSSQTVLINEGFSSGALPAGWSNINNGGTAGQTWEFNDPGTRTITAGNISGNYAILDSDNYGSGNNQNARLITPAFSTGIYETITLEFDYQYRDFDGGESCVVEVYNGSIWIEVFRKELGEENYVSASTGANLETIDITSETNGVSNAQVRFTYIGAYDWWWAIDNVKITGTLPSSVNSYLGPGGVGKTDGSSSLKFWIRTDNGVSTTGTLVDGVSNSAGVGALDISETGTQRPTLVSSAINGYNEISFSGSNRLRTGLTLTTSNFVTNQASSFTVARANNTTQSTSVYTTDPLVATTRFSNHIPWSGTVYYDFGTCCGTSARIAVSSLTGLTSYSLWTYDANSATGKQLYRNGTLLQNRAGVSSYTSHATQRFNLGANTSGSGGFIGDIAEVIIFKDKLNTAQRIIVNNYLSAKFGLTLNVNDFYTQDNGGGNFDHNVAGIGRASDASLHVDSQGTGIIRINTPSNLNNDEFLFWGEETKGATYNFTTDVNHVERLNSKWRVSKRNDVGTVSVVVKASDLTFASADGCNLIRLIVSNVSDFSSGKTTYNFTLSGGVYTATNVSFTDGDYFTLEYVDQIILDATAVYNGSGTANVPDITDGCYKLLIKATADGTPSLAENAHVREIQVEAGGKLVVNTGIYLQVAKGINNAGDIRLIGNSQIIQKHTGISQVTGTGKLYMDQTSVNTDVYQSGYWSSPVTREGTAFFIKDILKDGTTPTSATSGTNEITFTDIHTLDGSLGPPIEISGRWLAKLINATDWTRQISPTTVVFKPGEGWNMKGLGANFTFKGIANDGDYMSSIDQDKLSLIGNPYPSALDADQFINDNVEGSTNSAIVGTLYFWEAGNAATHVRGDYTGGYATYTLSGGVGTAAFNTKIPSQYIALGQAFFVWRSLAGTGTIQFNNNQRIFQTLGGGNQFYGKSNEKEAKTTDTIARLRFGFEFDSGDEGVFHRQVMIAFMGLTDNFENGYDGEMFDRKPADIALKTNDWSSDFVITAIEDFNENLKIPLSVYLDQNRSITFKLDKLENLTTDVYLNDTSTNQYYNLTDTNTSVSLDIDAGTYTDRFFITFTNTALAVDEEMFGESLLVSYQKEQEVLQIKNPERLSIESVEIYTILGQRIGVLKNNTLNKPVSYFSLKHISSAIYLINIKTDKGVVSKKIIVH